MNLRTRFYLLAACALVLTASPANAEIAVLISGRTLSIKSHRIDGDNIILKMRDGGEVTCDKSLIEEIVPDEIPFVEPQTVVAPEPGEGSTGSWRCGRVRAVRRNHHCHGASAWR